MQVPRATYRLQFSQHFRLENALKLLPYLQALGISHVYASPLFKATPQSEHGYDVCDFAQINPEIGSEADLARLVNALHEKHMGLVIDIVPNHMGVVSRENHWWWDVLTHGQNSRYANHFDIDWNPPEKNLRGKVILPVLGEDYPALLRKGELKVLPENAHFVLAYHQHRFPIAPATATKLAASALPEINSDFTALNELINRQHYHLEYHELGNTHLNYRRFFAVSSLAGMRVEEEKVFEATHALIRRWSEEGWVDGLRVDHPDGLRAPEKYLVWLRKLAPKAWIVVEKILEPGETLPESWPVAGTTGYDFLYQVNNLMVEPAGKPALTDFYAQFTGETIDYNSLALEKKRSILKSLLAAELNRLVRILFIIKARRPDMKLVSRETLREALVETIVHFPVYRSYVAEQGVGPSAADQAVINLAIKQASEYCPTLPKPIFSFIQDVLLNHPRGKSAKDFIARFQQLTGPVMAKGVEDTAFYCFNRLVSLNEVGGNPDRFGLGVEDIHNYLQERQRTFPHSQLTTATHDTKRGEDVRACLNLLSEIPETWIRTVKRWSAMNECHRRKNFPDRNSEYLFYQTLVGAWPLTVERVQLYMEKAALESGQHTNWLQRNQEYEKALQNFISESLRDPQFTTDLEAFTGTLANAAAVNSLAQTLVKLTAPGVPDIYQGCELWDRSLVDPDNRRPVDFTSRQSLLEEAKSLSPEKIWERRAEGLPKLWLIQKTLHWRKACHDFETLDYQPLFATPPRGDHVFTFVRGEKAIVVVPRFLLKLNGMWDQTTIKLPEGRWSDEFTGETFEDKVLLETLFRRFPVALLVQKDNP